MLVSVRVDVVDVVVVVKDVLVVVVGIVRVVVKGMVVEMAYWLDKRLGWENVKDGNAYRWDYCGRGCCCDGCGGCEGCRCECRGFCGRGVDEDDC